MPKRSAKRPTDVRVLLADMLVDAHGDDEQLTALAEGIGAVLDFPVDVHVVGEPLSLLAIDYAGNTRRGIIARCSRQDGTEYIVSLADIELPSDAVGHVHIAAYSKWLGVEPAAPTRSPSTTRKLRKHKVSDDDIDLSQPVDLVVLAVKERAARCRLLDSERVVTLRAGSLYSMVPGQIVTVKPNKHWRHNGHPYLSGEIVSARIDAAALGLSPLALRDFGEWDPKREYWGEEGEPIEDWAKPIIARGPRPMFEMEQVLPGRDPEDIDSDPVLEANDLKEAGDSAGAHGVLGRLLEADLRCLDAHAHLGNMLFDMSPRWALSHYEVGVRIAELSLGHDFDGVLAWGLIENRPMLRCMQGYGLCLWRLESWQEAERIFERMLWMNPSDNQGIRFLLPEVRAHRAWVDDER